MSWTLVSLYMSTSLVTIRFSCLNISDDFVLNKKSQMFDRMTRISSYDNYSSVVLSPSYRCINTDLR